MNEKNTNAFEMINAGAAIASVAGAVVGWSLSIPLLVIFSIGIGFVAIFSMFDPDPKVQDPKKEQKGDDA